MTAVAFWDHYRGPKFERSAEAERPQEEGEDTVRHIQDSLELPIEDSTPIGDDTSDEGDAEPRRVLAFNKEEDGLWYIDYPQWAGPHKALMMVAGADTLLDLLNDGSNRVEIEVAYEDFEGASLLSRLDWRLTGGANYWFVPCEDDYEDDFDGFKVWLCPVTLFVFGSYPKYIYFKQVEVPALAE